MMWLSLHFAAPWKHIRSWQGKGKKKRMAVVQSQVCTRTQAIQKAHAAGAVSGPHLHFFHRKFKRVTWLHASRLLSVLIRTRSF